MAHERLHLPVLRSGDGCLYATAADFTAFWTAVFAGQIVSQASVAAMVRPSSETPSGRRYGMGFWLHPTRPIVILEGLDPGISFRSLHDPTTSRTLTVISNTSDGVRPITAALQECYELN